MTTGLDNVKPLSLTQQLAQELHVKPDQIDAAIALLDDGATVPFIARYRKEVTQGLTDTHLRQLEERLDYLRDLMQQKETAIKTIDEQGKLTPALSAQIEAAATKQILADLYAPFRPKRRSKATQAIEAGLEPLADQLWHNRTNAPESLAEQFINPEHKIETSKAALEGARQILAERWSEQPKVVQSLRDFFRQEAHIISKQKKASAKTTAQPLAASTSETSADEKATDAKTAPNQPPAKIDKKQEQIQKKAAKFTDYFDRHEAIRSIASHRTLALFRGRREGVLDLEINLPNLDTKEQHPCVGRLMQLLDFTPAGEPADEWLTQAIQWCWRVKLQGKIENELLAEIKERADLESIDVFARNLKHLLLSAPAGQKTTLGLDPGLRTGVKLALVDNTGQVVTHETIYPHAPKNKWDEALQTLKTLCETHKVELIAIGNGTASRETDKLVAQLIRDYPELGVKKAVVSEAGASIYSASEYASQELPKLDVAVRGAVSIARRLQDPLAELVKIEPKSIGVGQYQHDVSQPKLAKSLDAVVEDCVNHVGVDVNTASAPLLARVAGLNETIAQNLVNFRNEQGAFASRDALKKVPRFGSRTFEQAAGFLRIAKSENPLDNSAVHPETYPLVTKIAEALSLPVESLIANDEALKKIEAQQFVDEQYGLLTVQDVIAELEKPGRDPRPAFKTVSFREDVHEIKDLQQNMILDGIITNVTNFGAFVDIGVHQDGLVHISALKDGFVSDPHQVVKTGDVVKVKVLNADVQRQRIDLTMRLQDTATQQASPKTNNNSRSTSPRTNEPRSAGQPQHTAGTRHNKSRQQRPKEQKPVTSITKGKEKALPPGKTGTFADLFAHLKK